MGRKAIDRTGEESINNFGSKMIIKEYRNATDIDVYFPEYNWIAKNKQYHNFKNGCVKCPYERRSYGIGYLGEGKYKVRENGKKTKISKPIMNKPNIKTVFAFFFASSKCPAPYNFATTIAPPPASPSPREVSSILI